MNSISKTMACYWGLMLAVVMCGCGNPNAQDATGKPIADVVEGDVNGLPLHKIKLPTGFKIDVFAEVNNARSLARSPKGTIYVGNRRSDKVYALRDEDGDHKAEKKFVIASGLTMPNGVAFYKGALYVAEVNRILRYDDIENRLDNPPEPVVVYDKFPTESHHGWKYIAFGPDNKLYVPVGAPCNICKSDDEVFASITRMNPDGTGLEVFAHGVRNTVGFTWHPTSKALWFTDNGRDMLGDNFPPCELNRADKPGAHYGYPYCHAGDISDPEFGDQGPCANYVTPAQKLGPHVAPLGIKFCQGDMFPEKYQGMAFIAEHGSWNRSRKIGYRVSIVPVEGGRATGYETFAEGWLDDDKQEAWGRPVDLLQLPDGSMLLSDDFAHVVYRISYEG